jgi:hypothetical protein
LTPTTASGNRGEATEEATEAGLYGKEGGAPPPEGGTQWPVIIGGVIGGLLALATILALLFLVTRRRKTSSSVEIRSTITESVLLLETPLVLDTEMVQCTQDNPLGSFDGGEPETYLEDPLD